MVTCVSNGLLKTGAIPTSVSRGATSALSLGTPTATNVLLLSVLHPSPHCALPIEQRIRICLTV